MRETKTIAFALVLILPLLMITGSVMPVLGAQVGLRVDTTIVYHGYPKTVLVTGYSHGELGFIKWVSLHRGTNYLTVEFEHGFVREGTSFRIQVEGKSVYGVNQYGPIREHVYIELGYKQHEYEGHGYLPPLKDPYWRSWLYDKFFGHE